MNVRAILNTIIIILSTLLAISLYFTLPGMTLMATRNMHLTDTKPYAMSDRVIDDTHDPYVIQQGQYISVVEKEYPDNTMQVATCSVGYIDTLQRKLYVAAHCAVPDKDNKNSPVREVLLRDITVGEIYPNRNYNEENMANDWTVIKITNDDIVLKPNRFSGDVIVSPENVKPGDKVYSYGSKSGLSEGVVFGVKGNQIYTTSTIIDHGDSGGAAWIEGKGFIGVLSNKRGYSKEDLDKNLGGYVTVINAVNTRYDETVNFTEIERMYARWFYSQGIKNIL